MKNIISILFIVLLSIPAASQVHYFTIDDQTRQYYLHRPNSLTADAPLVFVLHGYSGSASSIRSYSGMDQIANANGFAVCYPQGTKDQWNNRFWQVGYSFHQSKIVDDVKFITTLAQYLQSEYNLSSQNTFCTGMSNGGDMSYLLACQASDVFSAVAPVAGCMMDWIYKSCDPVKPIPLFEIHGTRDNITYWNGDINDNQGYGPYLDVPTTINYWAQLNNCTQTIIDTLPNINYSDGSIVISEKYTNGINNNEVWLYKIVNGRHDWPGSSGNRDINASVEIWKFFDQVINNTTPIRRKREIQKSNSFTLHQNYPNPFNPETIISYELREEALVILTVYDMPGREITKLVNTTQKPGLKTIQWNATDSRGNSVTAGVYLYQIEADQCIQTRKLILLK